MPASPEFWASPGRPLSVEENRRRQCKLVELRRLATVFRPDICARLAQLAAKVNSLHGVGVC